MKRLMMMTIAMALLALSSNASANEALLRASSNIHKAKSTSLEISNLHASKLESRRERAGSPDLAVNENGEITSFGRVIEGEELYLLLGRPDLAQAIAERERQNTIGNGLILAGAAGQVVSVFWMTAEFGNFLMGFAYPAGAGRGANASLLGPTVLGVGSLGVMAGGFVMKNQSTDPLTQEEKIQLVESQLGVPSTNVPRAQMTLRF